MVFKVQGKQDFLMNQIFSRNVCNAMSKQGENPRSLSQALKGRIPQRRFFALLEGRAAPSLYEVYCLANILNVSLDSLLN
jgi:hypothetical protein